MVRVDEIALRDLPSWLVRGEAALARIELWEATSLAPSAKPTCVETFTHAEAPVVRVLASRWCMLIADRSEAHDEASYAVLAFDAGAAVPRRAIVVGALPRRRRPIMKRWTDEAAFRLAGELLTAMLSGRFVRRRPDAMQNAVTAALRPRPNCLALSTESVRHWWLHAWRRRQ